MTRNTREMAGMFISCIACIALLSTILPQLLNGMIGLILIGGALLSSGLLVVSDVMAGRNALKSIIGLVITGGLTYLMIAAPMWYLSSLASSGKLFDLSFMVK